MLSYDQCKDNFDALCAQSKNRATDRNEAMARLQFIDRLLFECLGWNKQTEVDVEDHLEGDYADYILKDNRGLMIVEAKRDGIYFEIPAGLKEIERKLNNLIKDNKSIKDACRQAMGYATERGIPIAVICNGHQLIAFVATRQDGIKPLEGKALVLGSLEQMHENFFDMWQALSKPAVVEGRLLNRLTKNLSGLIPLVRLFPFDYPIANSQFRVEWEWPLTRGVRLA